MPAPISKYIELDGRVKSRRERIESMQHARQQGVYDGDDYEQQLAEAQRDLDDAIAARAALDDGASP